MNEQLKFETDMTLDYTSYSWAMYYLNSGNLYLARIIYALLPIYGACVWFLFGRELMGLSAVMIVLGVLINGYHYFILPKRIKKIIAMFEKNEEHKNHYQFFETYVERTNATGNQIVKYENLCALRENDAYFAFWAEPNKIIILDKKNIEENQQEFLRGIVSKSMSDKYEKKFRTRRVVEIALILFMIGYLLAAFVLTR